MECFRQKQWKDASLKFTKEINDMIQKHGQEKSDCETLVFCAISLLEMGNEKSGQAFSHLRKATNHHTEKGPTFTKNALIYHVCI